MTTTTTCAQCGEPWPHQSTVLSPDQDCASDLFDEPEEKANASPQATSEHWPRERFVGTLIGPAGGVVVKSGIQRLDLELMYGSAPALRVAATLQNGEPYIFVRVRAEDGGQLVERVLYDGPLALAHRPSETEPGPIPTDGC